MGPGGVGYWTELWSRSTSKLLRDQNAIQAHAVQATDDDRQTLDTVLSLMVSCAHHCPPPGLLVAICHSTAGHYLGLGGGPLLPPAARSPWPRSYP